MLAWKNGPPSVQMEAFFFSLLLRETDRAKSFLRYVGTVKTDDCLPRRAIYLGNIQKVDNFILESVSLAAK
jgi:hypothetical protein